MASKAGGQPGGGCVLASKVGGQPGGGGVLASKAGGQPGGGGVLGASEGRRGSQEEEKTDCVNSCRKVKLDEA